VLNEYSQIGGFSVGFSFWTAVHGTFPFAFLRISNESLRITLGIWKFGIPLKFTPPEIVSIKKQKGILSTGIVIKHNKKKCLPCIMFWTFDYPKLKMELNRFGYYVVESEQSEVSGLRS
jgi:hypothetical protein